MVIGEGKNNIFLQGKKFFFAFPYLKHAPSGGKGGGLLKKKVGYQENKNCFYTLWAPPIEWAWLNSNFHHLSYPPN